MYRPQGATSSTTMTMAASEELGLGFSLVLSSVTLDLHYLQFAST